MMKISGDSIRVSAISLGLQRLAIINGQLVGEGEDIVIRTAAGPIALTLRVEKISDRKVELRSGTQVITARLEPVPASKPKS
jgi:hypothetical protein